MSSILGIPNSKTPLIDVFNNSPTRVWYLFFTNIFNLLQGGNNGQWVPSITASISDPTFTYTSQIGEYNKLGTLTQCNGYVSWSSLSGGSGQLRISLPYVVNNSTYIGGIISSSDGVSFPALHDFITVEGAPSQSYLRLVGLKNGASSTPLTISELNSSGYIRFNIVYSS